MSDPKILQQGFATAEPYVYGNEIAQWKKPVASEPLSNYGYSIYPEPLAVRADKLAALTPCLQEARADHAAGPDRLPEEPRARRTT